MSEGVVTFTLDEFHRGWSAVEGEVIEEGFVSIFVNGEELATVMCSPREQDRFAIGFLCNEGIIDSLADVRAVHICPSGACVDVWLTRSDYVRPNRLILTSGCGGGVTFDDLTRTQEPIQDDTRLPVARLEGCIDELYKASQLHRVTGGVHTSALFHQTTLVSVAEDVGRHNTLDKVRGDCLLHGVETRGGLLVSTGRISSEMLNKAVRMGCPIVVSRTSPTSLSVSLAQAWNLTLVGYLRRGRMTVYANGWRLGLA
jgi:FdhD protein